ncbi:hypothetical protein WN943_025184 [Citrus x changshan-huyou]
MVLQGPWVGFSIDYSPIFPFCFSLRKPGRFFFFVFSFFNQICISQSPLKKYLSHFTICL